MRTDMKKVLTERPRSGSAKSYRNVRQRENRGDLENLPSHRGIRKPYGWDTKEFNDLVGPLRRYLYGCVGRKWDDVWSEICQTISSDSVVGDHLRQHVGFEFDRNIVVVDDKVYAIGYNGLRTPWRLYVDPRDGLIYYNDDTHGKTAQRSIAIDGMHYHRGEDGVLYPAGTNYHLRNGRYPLKLIDRRKAMQIEGIWYWIDMAETPPSYDQRYFKDGKMLTRRIFSPRYDFILREYIQEGRYHASKQQIASRDLRRYGLRNLIR